MSQEDSTDEAKPATGQRRALELRIALVCYGGVSLAVYMHGVTREILALVRASKAVHGSAKASEPSTSQAVYERLLSIIGERLELRVVVDVIAGASAGGINGIMLARALAFDLPLSSHRKMWLELADVTELLDPAGKARAWSKPFMRPMLSFLSWWQRKSLGPVASEAARSLEVRQKISLLTRSRWFQPPFSGERMCEMMLDGLASMGGDSASDGSLMPQGHPLDLFVTSTDFWGHRQLLTLHDPPVIVEREHRQIITFNHIGFANGDRSTQMSETDIPNLAFAARATSCFPGAFPPLQLRELDDVLQLRRQTWTTREAFVKRSFQAQTAQGENVEDASFIDGSVLMNKPLALAIKAVQDRPASRQVDRRIVYIDPNPDKRVRLQDGPPGFFTTLKGALSDIPRNQPIRDDLEWLGAFNMRADNLKQILSALTPKVSRMVSGIRKGLWGRPLTPEKIGQWREKAHVAAAENCGFAYGGYARLKVLTVLEQVAALVQKSDGEAEEDSIRLQLDAWASRSGVLPIDDASVESQNADEAGWVGFLRTFDVHYRVRRLRFLLRRVNELYRNLSDDDASTSDWLNACKTLLYDTIQTYELAALKDGMPEARAVFFPPDSRPQEGDIDAFMEAFGEGLELKDLDKAFEARFAALYNDAPDRDIPARVLDSYLGFAFFDVATLPMTQWRDLYELDEVRGDRISANVSNWLYRGCAGQILKVAELGNFGAFFSRAYRENDYLWGRLTGAERVIDIVLSAVPEHYFGQSVAKLKQEAFQAILDEETDYLKHIPDVITDLRKRVASMV